jgi:L-fuconolactonase
MRIDAHHHFWTLGVNDCAWPTPDLVPIYRDYAPVDLAPLAAKAGVDGTVLVQTQPSDKDTDFILRVADQNDLVKAVVGWVDLKSPTAPARIAELARHPKMRGLRPMLQILPQDDWIADPALEPAIAAMIAHRLSFDALVFTRHLPFLRAFAQHHPMLPIVIDHGAKPPIADGLLDPWREEMRSLATLPNVCCKLSGLVTEAAPGWRPEQLAPYVRHLVEIFGPDRLMWGSDWPVLELRTGYQTWLDVAESLAGARDLAAKAALFGGTARRFYRIL